MARSWVLYDAYGRLAPPLRAKRLPDDPVAIRPKGRHCPAGHSQSGFDNSAIFR